MDDLIKKHLQDILTAIEEIESFFGDKPKLFDDFYSNLCLRRAIERNIEIIGEAMNRILKTDRNIAITNSRKDAPLLWKLKRKISNLIEPVLLTEDTNNPLYADILKTGILI